MQHGSQDQVCYGVSAALVGTKWLFWTVYSLQCASGICESKQRSPLSAFSVFMHSENLYMICKVENSLEETGAAWRLGKVYQSCIKDQLLMKVLHQNIFLG